MMSTNNIFGPANGKPMMSPVSRYRDGLLLHDDVLARVELVRG